MDNQGIDIDILIAKHLTGEASQQEKIDLRQWINSNQNNREEFNKIVLTYQLSKGSENKEHKAVVFSNLQNRIERNQWLEVETHGGFKKNKYWWIAAATILVFSTLSVFFYQNQNISEAEDFNIVKKTNPAGQKSKIFLPDGSIAWLNSESSISYESEFNDSTRQIHLEGEAYFEVNKDKNKPFVVYSGTVSTTALGTAFNVNAFNEKNITVSLTQGKVNVEANIASGSNQGLIINAGEGVVYSSENHSAINKIIIDPAKVMMWRDGLLYLENSTLSETITKLERWYGVSIVLNNKPKDNWSANGLFDNEYLENVLHSLSFSQEFNYEIKGKQVYVTFKQKMPM